MTKQGREMAYFITPSIVPDNMPRPDANGALHGIRTLHTLMCTEVDRIERAMQEARQPSITETSDDELVDAYVHIYTNLISGLASVEEALEWLHRVH